MSIDIRDRIVEFKRINASELTPHPQNWRKHPKAQQAAISGILKEVGYVDALMVREHDGGYQIIDGHLRAETTPDAEVPVLVVDLNDAETALVLATFDPLAAMAESSGEKLKELLEGITANNQEMADLLSLIGADYNALDPKVSVDETQPIEPTGEASGVRMVQLFLDEDCIGDFHEWTSNLGKYYGTENITDTVMEVLKNANHSLPK